MYWSVSHAPQGCRFCNITRVLDGTGMVNCNTFIARENLLGDLLTHTLIFILVCACIHTCNRTELGSGLWVDGVRRLQLQAAVEAEQVHNHQ
jgi:hypothetical protein